MKKIYLVLFLAFIVSCSDNSTNSSDVGASKITIYYHTVQGDTSGRKFMEIEFDGFSNWQERMYYNNYGKDYKKGMREPIGDIFAFDMSKYGCPTLVKYYYTATTTATEVWKFDANKRLESIEYQESGDTSFYYKDVFLLANGKLDKKIRNYLSGNRKTLYIYGTNGYLSSIEYYNTDGSFSNKLEYLHNTNNQITSIIKTDSSAYKHVLNYYYDSNSMLSREVDLVIRNNDTLQNRSRSYVLSNGSLVEETTKDYYKYDSKGNITEYYNPVNTYRYTVVYSK